MAIQQEPAHHPQQALAAALERVGDRWSLLLVDALLGGPRRYGELQAAVDGIATNVLSQRLKQLDRRGVIVSRPYSPRPPRYAYEPTPAPPGLAGGLRLRGQRGPHPIRTEAR